MDGKVTYRTVQELSQDYQFLLAEIKQETPPTEIPQLDQLFVQAVSEDLKDKLLQHLLPNPTTTNDENLHRFNQIVLRAITAEKELKTVTTIAERAAFRQTRSSARGGYQVAQRTGPKTFLVPGGPISNIPIEQRVYLESVCETNTVVKCDALPHSSGFIMVPTCFLRTHNPEVSPRQEEIMAEAIVAMESAEGLVLASIVEEALVNSSGMKVPIKCFG